MLLDYLEYVPHVTGLSRVCVLSCKTMLCMCFMLLGNLEYMYRVTTLSRVCVSLDFELKKVLLPPREFCRHILS